MKSKISSKVIYTAVASFAVIIVALISFSLFHAADKTDASEKVIATKDNAVSASAMNITSDDSSMPESFLIKGVSAEAVAYETDAPTEEATEPPIPKKYKINGVPVLAQGGALGGACETYACTMLLQSYGFDIDEYEFVDKYLLCIPVGGTGPDMNSAYAGQIHNGFGVYSPAMAKFMNQYLRTTDTKLRAYSIEGISLAQLAKKYIIHDTPVMVWATVNMVEPYPDGSWTVEYVDENAKYKPGDTISWPRGEHCLVLIGYDENDYYFADSCAAAVSHFDKKLCEKRYKQLGTQAIVLEEY